MCTSTHETSQTARQFSALIKILDAHNRDASRLVPILQDVQNEYRYLPEEVLAFVATSLRISPSQVYGVATFYGHFAMEPKGKYTIRVCDGTACHVKGSGEIVDALRRHLGVTQEQNTTPDMLFTLETVGCVGACGLAPAVVVNEDVHGQMKVDKTLALIGQIQAEENAR